MTNKVDSGMSYETKTIIVVLTLLFITPVGLVLMWIWMKWPLWLRILLTVLPFLFVFLIMGFVLTILALVFSNKDVQKQIREDTKVRMSQFPETSQKPVPPLVDTTNWKTYTDTSIGYSLQYPQNSSYNVVKESNEIVTVFFTLPHDGVFEIVHHPDGRGVNPIQEQTITIGGNKLTKFYDEKNSVITTSIVSPDTNENIGFYFMLGNTDKEIEENDAIVNTILSTFKFIQ